METTQQEQSASAQPVRLPVASGFGLAVSGLAIGGFVAVLWGTLRPTGFGAGLTAMMLALALAELLIAKPTKTFARALTNNSDPSPAFFQQILGILMLRWLVTVVIFGTLWVSGALPLFQDTPGLVLAILSLGPVLSMVRIAGFWSVRSRLRRTFLGQPALWTLSCISAACAAAAGAQSATTLIVVPLIWGVTLLAIQIPTLPNLTENTKYPRAAPITGPLIFDSARNADILVVAIFLPAQAAAKYLAARVLAGLVGAILNQLSSGARPRLAQLYQAGQMQHFRAAAARVNLGFLLAGGGVFLAILGAGPMLLARMGFGIEGNPLVWLLAARATPTLFGNAASLMVIAGQRTKMQLSAGVICAAAVCAAAIWPPAGPNELARYVALAHFAFFAITASWVARYLGVWPGITGVFYRQLKLT